MHDMRVKMCFHSFFIIILLYAKIKIITLYYMTSTAGLVLQ